METQRSVIRTILLEFERQNIRYCVLRNYEFLFDAAFLPESLDTVIAERDMQKAHQILLSLGFQKRRQQFSLQHQAYFTFVDLKPVTFDIQVGGVYWNDMLYLDETILTNRIKKGFFYVPSDRDTFVMLVAHSILGKRYFKPKYQQILNSIAVNEHLVHQELSLIFNATIASSLMGKIKAKKFPEINTHLLLIYFLFKKPVRLWTLTLLFLRWVRWKKFFHSYPLISIIGPDGAGKSTLVQKLEQHLQQYKRKVQVVYIGRGRGQVLPFRRLGNAYKHQEKKQDSQRSPVFWKRKILYTAAVPLFALDLWLRYWFKIMPLRKRRTIVITDRYCTDILLMEHVPLWFKKFLFRLFPRPTLTFYLYNSPEVLHERRPEESITELQRQLQLFEQINQHLKAERVLTDEKEKMSETVAVKVKRYIYTRWY